MALIKEVADKEKKRKASLTVAQRTEEAKKSAAAISKPKTTPTQVDMLERRVIKTENKKKAAEVYRPNKYSYQNKSISQMNLPEYTAWANHYNAYALETLPTAVGTRGSQFWNPYLGGRSTVPDEIKAHFRDNYGYEGPFDDKFIEQFKPFEQFIETSDISWAASKPSANDPIEKWTGYYYNKIASWQAEDNDTKAQWDQYRSDCQTYYDEFKAITGRAPTIEEFTAAVDSNSYSKLAAINESLTNRDSTIQILNTGTFYTPHAVYGLYHALSEGQDISVDRDYFQDAVSYYASPISTAEEIKKYSWSGSDFRQMAPETYTSIENEIISSGDKEELAALRFTRNAAYQDPEDIEIALLVNEAYGYNHDDAWFEKAMAAAQQYLDVSYDINGIPTYTKPSSKGTVGEKMAWYIYQESLKREDTDAVEAEWESVVSLINNYAEANRTDYETSAQGAEDFKADVLYEIFGDEYDEVSGLKIPTLTSFFEGKKDLCRVSFASMENIEAMIGRAFMGESVDSETNYLLPVTEKKTEVDDSAELPPFYDEIQIMQGVEDAKSRADSLNILKDAVASLSSGNVNLSLSEFENAGLAILPERIMNDTNLSGILGNLLYQFKKFDYSELLGKDFTVEQATASDPMLKALGAEQIDVPVTVNDLFVLMNEMQYSFGMGDVTLGNGALALVIPNVDELQQHINSLHGRYGFQKTAHMLNSEIDVTAYRNTYNRAIEEGLNGEDATAVAFFAATEINPTVKEQALSYATPEAQTVFNEVVQAAMTEEGSSDVLAMAEQITTEVANVGTENDFDEIPKPEIAKLGSFLIPMLIGASKKATPGLAATTKDIMHDIATGDITPEDISKGVQVAIASGQMTPDEIQEDAERLVEPEKYALSPELEQSISRVEPSDAAKGITDVSAKIDELSARNTPEQVEKNKEAIDLSGREKWLEMSDFDAHLAAAQALGYKASPMFSVMSYMEAYGRYFSENEVREIYSAFEQGNLSAEQVMDVVDERVSNQSPAVLAATSRPEMLAESVAAAREYIENQRNGAAVVKPYTDSQLDVLSSVVDLYEKLGAYGYDYFTTTTAAELKEHIGADLVESDLLAETSPLSDLMYNMVGPEWDKPYKNEGVGFIETAAEATESIQRWVFALPYAGAKGLDYTMDKVTEYFGAKEAWDAYNGTVSQMADVYDEVQSGEKASQLRMQEHAKGHEQLAKEAAVGVVKILASKGIGTFLAAVSEAGIAGTGVMTSEKLLNLAGRGFDFSKFITRVPYSAFMGTENLIENYESGMNVLNAVGRAAISTMIEAVTESPAVDDLLSFKIGNQTLMQGALNGSKKLDAYKNMLLVNFANGLYHEIGEEELGIVINRFVDSAGLAATLEYDIGEAFAKGFEGIKEEAVSTAAATALTVLFLNVADLPSSAASYKYLESMFQRGEATPLDLDIITTMMVEDLKGRPFGAATEPDVKTESTAKAEEPTVQDILPDAPAPTTSEEEELQEAMKDVIVQIQNGEEVSTDLVEKINELGKQMQTPNVLGDLDSVESGTEPLEPEAAELTPDVNVFDNAHDDMPPEPAQEAVKNEEPPMQEEEPANEVAAVPELSLGAQRIADYIEQSDSEVAKSLASHLAEQQVQEMIENDPGIQSKQEELQTAEEEIQALEAKAAQHQEEADIATKQQEQAIAAAVNNGLDVNSPQVLNAKFSTAQARQAALDELKKVQEDIEKVKKNRERIERSIAKLKEDIELSKDEYEDLDLFMRDPSNRAIIDNDKAKHAVDSSVGAEMTSVDVHDREQKRKSKENVAINAYSEGTVTVEEYTDPGRWDVQDRPKDPDAWKPTKDEQNAAERDREKHIKLNKDFDEAIADESGWVEVNSNTYSAIADQLMEKRGYISPSLVRPKYDNGSVASGVAYIDGVPMDVYGVNGIYGDGKTDTTEKYAHVTESDRYLIVSKVDEETALNNDDLERYDGLTKEGNNGSTGLETLRENVAAAAKQLEYFQTRKAKLELELAQIKEKIANGNTDLNSQYAKVSEDLKNSKRSVITSEAQLASSQRLLDEAISFLEGFSDKVNFETKLSVGFSEDDASYHSEARKALDDHRRRNREYIVIDKTGRDAVERRKFYADNHAATILENIGDDVDTLRALYTQEKYFYRGGKPPKTLDDWAGKEKGYIQRTIDAMAEGMDYEDLYARLYGMYYNKAFGAGGSEFGDVSQTLVGYKALEDFVSQNGGFKNNDGTEGAFTPRGTRTYLVREDVYSTYINGSGWMDLKDDPHTADDYRTSMAAKIDLFATQNNLSPEERNYLYTSHLLSPKDKDGFELVAQDDANTLKIKRDAIDTTDTNAAIRDSNGEYNVAKAREIVASTVLYINDILAGKHNKKGMNPEDRAAHIKKLVEKRNVLLIDMFTDDGTIVHRQYGKSYVDNTDGKVKRWTPSIEEIESKAVRIDLNRYLNNRKRGEDGSRVNFRLEQRHAADEQKRAYDSEAVHKDNAYMRPASWLKEDLAASQSHFENLMKTVTDMAATTEGQQYAAYTFLGAYANLVENKIYSLSKDWKNGAIPKNMLGNAVSDMHALQQKLKYAYELMSTLDGYGTKADSIEAQMNAALGENRTDEKMWVQAAVKEGKPLLKELQDGYDRLNARYDALAAFGDDSILSKAEMASVAALAKTYQYKINLMKNAGVQLDGYVPGRQQESSAIAESSQPAAKDNNVPSKPFFRTNADNFSEIISSMQGKEYTSVHEMRSDLMKLIRMQRRGAHVEHLTSRIMSDYADLLTKDMSLDEKIDKLSEMKTYAQFRAGRGRFTVFGGVDYDEKIINAINGKPSEGISKEERKKARDQVRNIRNKAGDYKSVKAIENARKRLDAAEVAGIDVTDVRAALDANEAALNGEAPSSPTVNLQLFGDSTIAKIRDGIDHHIKSVLDTLHPVKKEHDQSYDGWEDSIWRNKVKSSYSKTVVKELEDNVHLVDSMDGYSSLKKRIVRTQREIDAIQKEIDKIADGEGRKAEIQQLINERTRLKESRSRDVRIVMASDFIDFATSRESGVNPPVDPRNPTEMEKGVQSASAKYRFDKAKKTLTVMFTYLKNLPGGKANGDGTLFTTKQIADAFSLVDSETMAEDHEVARLISAEKNDIMRHRAYLKFRQAYLKSLSADENTGMDKAIREFKEAILKLDDPRGYTYSEVMDRSRNEKRIQKAIDKILEDFDYAYRHVAAYQREAEINGLQQMVEIIDATLERSKRIASNLFRTSSPNIERALNHETGGHYPRQFIDAMAQTVINASERNSNPKHALSRELDSPRRAIERFLGKGAGLFNSVYMDPVRKANAELERSLEDIDGRVAALKLSKPARNAISKVLDMGLSEADIYANYGDAANEIIAGAKAVKKILNEIYSKVDAAFRRNGIEPPKWRKNYVPHIKKATGLAKLAGAKTNWDDLPTELLGKTEEYKPTHQWAASLMERQGDSMEGCMTDIVEIISTYSRAMLPIALYTDSAIALRDLNDVLREDMKYNEEGSVSKESASRMGVFVTYLDDVANQIAGKKAAHSADRFLESKVGGRVALNVIQKLKTFSGYSATAANANVITANILPLTVAFSMDPINTIKGMHRALVSSVDHEMSDFIQARKGSELMELDSGNKVINFMYKPAQKVDNFAAASIWEGGYRRFLQLGMDDAQARKNADDYTARIMASKQRGDIPLAYSSVIGSTALQFTMEAVNTLSYLQHDMRHMMTANAKSIVSGAAKYIAALLAFFLQGYLFNEVTGRKTAPDIIGSVQDAVTGRDEDDTAMDVIGQILLNMGDSLNPLDNVTDVFTDGADLVKAVALTSNIKSTWENVRDAATSEDFEGFAKNVAAAVLNWTPGGTAIERVGKTVEASAKGYTESAAGRVMHTFSPDPLNVAMASLLGMNSSREGRAYVDSGYRTLSDTKTEAMKRLMDDYGLSAEDAYRIIQSETEENAAKKDAREAVKDGNDPAEHLERAEQIRVERDMPSDVAAWAANEQDAEWFQKGVELWRESGLDVYPKDLVFEEGTMTPEAIESANAYYRKQYKYIVSSWDGPAKGLEKELDRAAKRARAKYK